MFKTHKASYLIIAILIALGIGAFVLVKIYDFKTDEEASVLTPVVKHEESKKTVEDWKTYRNEEYGFEFGLPEDWKLFSEKKPQEVGPQLVLNFASAKAQKTPKLDLYGGELSILVSENPRDLKMEQYLGYESLSQYASGSMEDYIVDGKQAKIFLGITGEVTLDAALIKGDSIFIEIDDSSIEILLSKILSTFKFIEPK